MVETGVVLERAPDNLVRVEITRTAACDGCQARGACALVLQDRRLVMTAADPLGAPAGATVTLELADGAFLSACAAVYLIPLAGLVAGALATWMALGLLAPAAERDVPAALGALGGAALGLAVVRLLDGRLRARRRGGADRFRPVVTAIVN